VIPLSVQHVRDQNHPSLNVKHSFKFDALYVTRVKHEISMAIKVLCMVFFVMLLPSSVWKMEAAWPFEMFISCHITARCYNAEDDFCRYSPC
jgi:hypothetical protein